MTRIAEHMTRQPWSIQLDDSVGIARRMMAEREIHHLPVLDGKELVGILSDRDLATAAAHLGATVEQIMTTTGIRVDIETPLADVLQRMIDRQSDAAVVTSQGEVVGIFTASDALRLLRDLQ